MTDTPDPKLEEAAFKALDTSKIKEEIASDITPEIERLAEEKAQAIAEIKAKEIANDIVTEKMAELGKRISGTEDKPQYSWEKDGRDKPADWKEAMSEAERIADEKADAKIKNWQTEQKKTEDNNLNQTYKNREVLIRAWDGDVNDLQTDNLIPKYSQNVQDKINKGISLNRDDFEIDPGLKARKELFELAQEYKTTPYKAYHRYYKKQPAGARAPVWTGASGGSMAPQDEYTYDEISKIGKQVSNR